MIVGKIVLYLAMSVDGYIADEQGGVSWLEGDGSKPDTSGSYQIGRASCRERVSSPV